MASRQRDELDFRDEMRMPFEWGQAILRASAGKFRYQVYTAGGIATERPANLNASKTTRPLPEPTRPL